MTIRIAIPDPEVVQRFDRPGPRYTSYPTAVEFHDGVGESVYREHLAKANREHAGEPTSLYIHIPFCAKHCSYCGCHVIATPKREIAAQYLDYLGRELELVAALLPAAPQADPDALGRRHADLPRARRSSSSSSAWSPATSSSCPTPSAPSRSIRASPRRRISRRSPASASTA